MRKKTQETLIPNPVLRFNDFSKRIYDIYRQDNSVYMLTGKAKRFNWFGKKTYKHAMEKHVFSTPQHAMDYYNLMKYIKCYQTGSVSSEGNTITGGVNCFVEANTSYKVTSVYLRGVFHIIKDSAFVPVDKLSFFPCLHSVRVNRCVYSLLLLSLDSYNEQYSATPFTEVTMFRNEEEACEYEKIQHMIYEKYDLSEPIKQNQKQIDYMNKMCQLLQQIKQGKIYE